MNTESPSQSNFLNSQTRRPGYAQTFSRSTVGCRRSTSMVRLERMMRVMKIEDFEIWDKDSLIEEM
jgi:hypothetical protein